MPDTSQPPELREQDFIHEEYRQNPFPFWGWLTAIAAITVLFWGINAWFTSQIQEHVAESPFLQVSNRQLSLFLWQFPEHLRAHVSQKSGYLPAFQYVDRVGVEPEMADLYAVAPPELLFLYHTWQRQIADYYSPRPILVTEFRQFLKDSEEWLPQFWPKAPKEYVQFIENLRSKEENENLEKLPLTTLPQVVRQAFQGWRNYYKEGDAINQVKPTFAQMQAFLTNFPHYARNYWRNILADTAPHYLQSDSADPEAIIPPDELAPFLKAAFYNYTRVAQ